MPRHVRQQGAGDARGSRASGPGICRGKSAVILSPPGPDCHGGGEHMGHRIDRAEQPRIADAAEPQRPAGDDRAPYVQPRLDRLGVWSALTLQHSIPISP